MDGPPAETSPGWDVVTLPNAITVVRLLLVPVFLWMLFALDARWQAAILLGVIGATDWVDGYLARRLDQVSELGKILDPVADRLVLVVGGAAILADGSVPVWFAVAALARELLVGATALLLGALGARRIDVTWWGKSGTFGLLFAFPFFLAGSSTLWIAGWFTVGAWITGITGLAFSYVAAAQYVPLALAALRDGRAARRAGPSGDASAPWDEPRRFR